MKKIAKRIAFSVLAMAMCFSTALFTACGTQGEKGETGAQGVQGEKGETGAQGKPGTDGKSAYEIAVENGFKGTEAEWLESLKGGSGTEGKSAYEIYVESVPEGEKVMTKEEWLESLKGAGGGEGPRGPEGPQGPAGEVGTVWFTGNGLPSAQGDKLKDARKGDFYINLNTNTIYIMDEKGEWSFMMNVNDNNNISKWNGTIPGWTKPNLSEEEIIKNAPVSYVVNEELHTIDLYNADAFAWFAYRAVLGQEGFKGYTVNLHSDIDLDNQMWIPIGLGARSNAPRMAFQGIFNGNGHTVYNLNSEKFYNSIKYGKRVDNGVEAEGYYIEYNHKGEDGKTTLIKIPFQVKENREQLAIAMGGNKFGFKEGDGFTYGLFAKTSGATIRNLNVKGVKIDMPEKEVAGAPNTLKTDNVGIIVGYAYGSVTVENCTVGQFEHDKTVGYIKNCNTIGGIIGRCYAGTDIDGTGLADEGDEYGKIMIRNCTNNLDIVGAYGDKVAGIIAHPGYFADMLIEDCTNNGVIEGCVAGGIIAFREVQVNNGTMTMRDCTNNGDIIATQYGGGLIGDRSSAFEAGKKEIKSMFSMQNSTNNGDIIGKLGETVKTYSNGGQTVNVKYRQVRLGGLIGNLTMSPLEKSMYVNSNSNGRVIINDYTPDTATSDASAKVSVRAGGLIGSINCLKGSSADKIGQLTVACGNSADVIYKVAANKITIPNFNLTDNEDVNVCIGHMLIDHTETVTDATLEKVLKVVYFVNTGSVIKP